MANEKLKQNFKDIADSIRSKSGKTGKLDAAEMVTEINALDTSGIHPTGTKTITANGNNIDVTEYAAVKVNVQPTGGTYDITENNFYDVSNYAYANVHVTPKANIFGNKISIEGEEGHGTNFIISVQAETGNYLGQVSSSSAGYFEGWLIGDAVNTFDDFMQQQYLVLPIIAPTGEGITYEFQGCLSSPAFLFTGREETPEPEYWWSECPVKDLNGTLLGYIDIKIEGLYGN